MDPLKVFISYRRADTQHLAGRLGDRVGQRFTLFMDIDDIPPGVDFSTTLTEAVNEADVLLVLVGPRFLAADDTGVRRVDRTGDWVVAEVSAALDRGIAVIPVLVDGARMPADEELPTSIRPMGRRQALRVGHSSFNADVVGLVEVLSEMETRKNTLPMPAVAATPQPRPRPALIPADPRRLGPAVAGALASLAAIWLLLSERLFLLALLVAVLVTALVMGLLLLDIWRSDRSARLAVLRIAVIEAGLGVALVLVGFASAAETFQEAHYYAIDGDTTYTSDAATLLLVPAGLTLVAAAVGRERWGSGGLWPALVFLTWSVLTMLIVVGLYEV